MGLIDIARASQAATLAALANSGAAGNAYLRSLIDAASAAIQDHCHLDIAQATYSEVYSGGVYIREPIKLRQYPVSRIDRISLGIRAMQVLNSGATVQRALVETVDDGSGNCASLTLTRVANGVKSSDSVSCTTNLTVQAVANAIAGLGNGWSTTIYGGAAGSYGPFPSSDLRTIAGAFSAMVGGSYLEIWEDWYGWTSLAFWPDDPENYGSIMPFWRLDSDTGEVWGQFPRGVVNVRIGYTAGHAAVPAPVQEACVQLALWLYQNSQTNQAISEQRVGPSEYELSDARVWPPVVRQLLAPYVAHSKVMFRN